MATANVLALHPRDIVGSEWDSVETTQPKQADSGINWHKTCQEMLDKNQRWLTSNYLLGDREEAQFKREQIYVPLALGQRTKPDKRSGEFLPEDGTRVYEPQYEQKVRFVEC